MAPLFAFLFAVLLHVTAADLLAWGARRRATDLSGAAEEARRRLHSMTTDLRQGMDALQATGPVQRVRAQLHEVEDLLNELPSARGKVERAFGELPAWVQSELEAALRPRGLLSRFPGQELVVRPLRRALAWRRAGRLVRSSAVADLSGSWRLAERERMDAFLKETGFSALQRAVVLKAGQVQVIAIEGGALTVLTRDMRGTSELSLPLNGVGVVQADGDGAEPIRRAAFIEGQDLVITESEPRSGETLAVCRRSLTPDGRMAVEVRKRPRRGEGFVSMRVIFCPTDQ